MMSPNKNGETLFEIGREHSLFWWCFSILWFIHQALSICWMSLSNFNGQRTKWQIYTFGFCHLTLIYITIRDESELSSAQIQLELARLVRFSARLGSARRIFKPARVLEILLERAVLSLRFFMNCWKILIIDYKFSH